MPEPSDEWLTAREATLRLGVKLQTLYAYASRGLVRSIPGPHGRGRRYGADDIQRLKARHDARSGHAPVAAGALRWGEPVLETAISDVRSDGPYYRGVALAELVERRVTFEDVCTLLWHGALPEVSRAVAVLEPPTGFRVRALPVSGDPISSLALITSALADTPLLRAPAAEDLELERARRLLPFLATHVRGTVDKAPRETRIAARLLRALGSVPRARDVDLVDRALVLCADHELNASTFAARVTASAGAGLCASLAAALHTLSGNKHGGMCERVEALLGEARGMRRPGDVVQARLRRGETVPGYGHPLYPQGDPRGALLLALAARAKRPSRDYRCMKAIHNAMEAAGQPRPTLDAGLVTLASALQLPSGSASAMFAVGRLAGWIAHILEQRQQGFMLRPRARYIGKP